MYKSSFLIESFCLLSDTLKYHLLFSAKAKQNFLSSCDILWDQPLYRAEVFKLSIGSSKECKERCINNLPAHWPLILANGKIMYYFNWIPNASFSYSQMKMLTFHYLPEMSNLSFYYCFFLSQKDMKCFLTFSIDLILLLFKSIWNPYRAAFVGLWRQSHADSCHHLLQDMLHSSKIMGIALSMRASFNFITSKTWKVIWI